MRLFIFTVACVIAASAYDFNDEVYNHFVREDIEHLQQDDVEHLINYRTKRQEPKPELKPVNPVPTTASSQTTTGATVNKVETTQQTVTAQAAGAVDKCKKRKFKSCCGDDIIDQMLEKDKDIKKDCYKQVTSTNTKEEKPFGGFDPFNCEKVNKTKKEWTCVMQCVGQKKNILDENGNIKEKDLLEHYRKEFTNEAWFLTMIEQAFPKCMEQVKTITFTKNKEDPLSCNTAPTKMHHCMWRELQLTCPNNKITDQKMCAKIREKIKKHEDLIPFRHAHHDDDK